jgi:hypothetical protein
MPGSGPCSYPVLPAPYADALREAVDYVLARYTSVVGLIASGTIIRGKPDPSSDLDIYVLHRDAYRQRVQKLFNGVPAEIFVNPPRMVERYFEEEERAGKPITAHMVGTGFLILQADPVVDELRRKAKGILSTLPPVPKDLTVPRYMIASLFEDAVDVIRRDPATAEMILCAAVDQMLRHAFTKSGRYIPRTKDLLRELAARFYGARCTRRRLRIGGLIADRVIGARGFFEWETKPDPVD